MGSPKTVKMAAIMGYPLAVPAWPRGTAFPEYEDEAMPSTDWDGEPLCGSKPLTKQSFPPTEKLFPNVPEHLRALLDDCKLDSWAQRKELADVLESYQDVFAAPGGPLGHTNLVKHNIDV